MAQPGHCNVFLFLLILALIIPVSADPAASDSPSPGITPARTPVPYSITLFIPSSNMMSSTQIMDIISGFNATGEVLIATSSGLSTYNGTWSTRHMTHVNVSEGLLDDFVTAIEYDHNGNLWIGYSEGIQIYNGNYYRTIRDQQLLKDRRVNDIQRWNDDMWIATGNSGIHRYRDGTWTWFQPFSDGGPGFYEVNSMIWDHTANATIIATERDGIWIIRSQDDPIRFECIAGKDSSYGLLNHVKRDYRGGVFFFNDSTIAHYSPEGSFSPVLTSRDLAMTHPQINDLISGPDGKLYLATDQGIYIWDDNRIYRHLDRFEGIGTSSIVKTINIDSLNRIWFSTPDNAGYYIDQSQSQTPIAIQLSTTAPTLTPSPTQPPSGNASGGRAYPGPIPTLREETGSAPTSSASENTAGGRAYPGPIPTLREDAVTAPATSPGDINAIIARIIESIRSFSISIGLKPRF